MAFFKPSDASMLRTAWELSAGLLSFVVALAIGWWFGGTLDLRLGTAPWLTWLFAAFGFAAGALNVYRTLSRALRPLDTARGRPDRVEGPHAAGRRAPRDRA